MKVMIEIGHPAHVHQFKNLFKELKILGWEVLFVAKNKEVAVNLLQKYDMPFKIIGSNRRNMIFKFLSYFSVLVKIFVFARRFNPDIFISRVSPFTGPVSFLLHKPHITFDDTEHVSFNDFIAARFADVILTGNSFFKNFGDLQIYYNGTIELAYLHRNRFKVNEQILNYLQLKRDEKYIVVRFVGWHAHHDVGKDRLTFEDKLAIIHTLSKKAKIFITSETPLPNELQKYKLKISPERLHDVLSYASLVISEGSTIVSESACLGVPSIYINPLKTGLTNEIIEYGLAIQSIKLEEILKFSNKILSGVISSQEIQANYHNYLKNKIDVTAFWIWFLANYPDSFMIIKKNPTFQYNFM